MNRQVTIQRSEIERFEITAGVFGAKAIDLRQTHSDWKFGMPLKSVVWDSDASRASHDATFNLANQFSHVADRLRQYGDISVSYTVFGMDLATEANHAQA